MARKFITVDVVDSFSPNGPTTAYRINVDHIVNYRPLSNPGRVGILVQHGERTHDYTVLAGIATIDALVGL